MQLANRAGPETGIRLAGGARKGVVGARALRALSSRGCPSFAPQSRPAPRRRRGEAAAGAERQHVVQGCLVRRGCEQVSLSRREAGECGRRVSRPMARGGGAPMIATCTCRLGRTATTVLPRSTGGFGAVPRRGGPWERSAALRVDRGGCWNPAGEDPGRTMGARGGNNREIEAGRNTGKKTDSQERQEGDRKKARARDRTGCTRFRKSAGVSSVPPLMIRGAPHNLGSGGLRDCAARWPSGSLRAACARTRRRSRSSTTGAGGPCTRTWSSGTSQRPRYAPAVLRRAPRPVPRRHAR